MFKKVAIVGVGLLGGSLARELKIKGLAENIVGVSRSESTAKKAVKLGVIDEILPLTKAVVNADLLVLATPMQAMMPLLHQVNNVVSANTLITDVGSVKTDLYQKIYSELPNLLKQFVFAHPIAGGEKSGVGASKVDLFQNKHVIITPTDQVTSDKVDLLTRMWKAVGAQVLSMSVQAHDAVFAKTSHLPHVVAFSLVNYLADQKNKDQLFELAASGFYDFTRIASSDAEMWRDICITNQQQIIEGIEGYIGQLHEIKENIRQLDQASILHYFQSAKFNRDDGLIKKHKPK